MRRIANAEMRNAFLGWQCRIRQIAMREYGGQPLPGMRPRVSTRSGESLSPGLIVLLLPLEPRESTAFFRYQVQKTNEPQKTREAGIGYLGAEFYQLPELFSDAMAAVFQPGSRLAEQILKASDVLLDFEQFSQSYRMFCGVRRLGKKDEAREAALWQARIFNRDIGNDSVVLSFSPDWASAHADPPA
ncbi:MAG: hypothetical protein JNM20_13025 [Rhizobiales bacterium]|nr:hypothetical protein [Hyphomicrobiales bacterium]